MHFRHDFFLRVITRYKAFPTHTVPCMHINTPAHTTTFPPPIYKHSFLKHFRNNKNEMCCSESQKPRKQKSTFMHGRVDWQHVWEMISCFTRVIFNAWVTVACWQKEERWKGFIEWVQDKAGNSWVLIPFFINLLYDFE